MILRVQKLIAMAYRLWFDGLFAPRPEVLEFAAAQRPQSSFLRVHSIDELAAARVDAVFWPDGPSESSSYLRDVGDGACIYKLMNAHFVPMNRYLRGPKDDKLVQGKLPTGVHRHGRWLLLTGSLEIFPESFTRGLQAPPTVRYDSGTWHFSLPKFSEYVDKPALYLELMSSHFGHVLTDMPGRLWPFGIPEATRFLSSLALVSMPVRPRIDLRKETWTAWTTGLLEAVGTSAERLLVPNKPVVFRELYVPSRIAPFRHPSGQRYNSLMERVGDQIQGEMPEGVDRKVYLSRSRLTSGSRVFSADLAVKLDEMFRAKGFTVVHPQELEPAAQIAMIRGADFVAGPAGSQLHLAVFSQRPVRMLRFAPSYFPGRCDREILHGKGGDLSEFLVDRPEEPDLPIHKIPWALKSSELVALGDFVDRWLQSTGPLDLVLSGRDDTG